MIVCDILIITLLDAERLSLTKSVSRKMLHLKLKYFEDVKLSTTLKKFIFLVFLYFHNNPKMLTSNNPKYVKNGII